MRWRKEVEVDSGRAANAADSSSVLGVPGTFAVTTLSTYRACPHARQGNSI